MISSVFTMVRWVRAENQKHNNQDDCHPEEEGVALDISYLEKSQEVSCTHGALGREASNHRINDEAVNDIEECSNSILEDRDDAFVDFVDVKLVSEKSYPHFL